jgi:hypothetical protein
MIIRPCAEFTSDLPEDVIESETDFIETGGRSVTEAIAGLLKDFGCTVDPPEYAGDHGWELYFRWRGRRVWAQITLIDGYIFMTEDLSWFSKHLKRNKLIYADALTRLAEALHADPRFHNIHWCFADELTCHKPGMAMPVSS